MSKYDEVYERLAQVFDPELDQTLTDLGFIHEIKIDESDITISFRLPTYWCAANFAFLMASDIKRRVTELPWVKNVRVRLVDHFASEPINYGVENNMSFKETFPNLSNEDLDNLRLHFRKKAFLARQERLYRHLKAIGKSDDDIAQMAISDLKELTDSVSNSLVGRYLEVISELFNQYSLCDNAFIDLNGTPIPAERMPEHMKLARSTRINQEVNGAYCCGLLQTRYQSAKDAVKEAFSAT
ncbi:metal-sulfur cluster assembly factor [Alicyclobacillus fructus]|uniref:metal-sulfur cluster assembly factor n=1 Tax=Alicyclobacillus fructus TaxID=2816082 RepID=UPI001A8CCBED|nr:iron-sulfur cluster assembly protein [Alicyclobacillus fructus]